MPAPDLPGSHIITTKSGGFYAVENLRAEASWVLGESGGIEVSFSVDEVEQVLAFSKTGQLAQVAQANEIAAGILRLERLVEEYRAARPESSRKLEIAVFGAVSLALTVLPGSATGDMDVIANTDFIRFLENRRKETNLDLDILPPSFMIYLGNWRERASKLTGYKGTDFLVFHPLDTVAQKLLRIDEEKFQSKDWPDIVDVMSVFHPNEEGLVTLLTENPARFRMADETEEAAMKRNTAKFLAAYLPGWSMERLQQESKDRRQKQRQSAGFEPLPEIDMPDVAGLEPRALPPGETPKV